LSLSLNVNHNHHHQHHVLLLLFFFFCFSFFLKKDKNKIIMANPPAVWVRAHQPCIALNESAMLAAAAPLARGRLRSGFVRTFV